MDLIFQRFKIRNHEKGVNLHFDQCQLKKRRSCETNLACVRLLSLVSRCSCQQGQRSWQLLYGGYEDHIQGLEHSEFAFVRLVARCKRLKNKTVRTRMNSFVSGFHDNFVPAPQTLIWRSYRCFFNSKSFFSVNELSSAIATIEFVTLEELQSRSHESYLLRELLSEIIFQL